MSVEEYEKLVTRKQDSHSDLSDLSSEAMLNKINRDIAGWRAGKEAEDEWEREMVLADEYGNERPFDPFQEMDSQTSAWHSAGAVLEDRYGEQWCDDSDDGVDEDEEEIDFKSFLNTGGSNEIKIEDVPFGLEQKHIPIPLVKGVEGGSWKEEPLLEEEPVFYEEPI
jgi:hypothetical protein